MTRTIFVAALLLALGCGRTDAVTKYESWADDACACKDAECSAALVARLAEMAKKYTGAKIQRSDSEAIMAAGARGAKCLLDARPAGAPTAAPAPTPTK